MRIIKARGDNRVHEALGPLRMMLGLAFCLMAPPLAFAQDSGTSLFEFVPKPVKPPTIVARRQSAELPTVNSRATSSVGAVRTITLEEAQQAASGQNPIVRLGQLQVEVAKQNRQVFEASYYPQISSTFLNMHFNKFMGEEIQL